MTLKKDEAPSTGPAGVNPPTGDEQDTDDVTQQGQQDDDVQDQQDDDDAGTGDDQGNGTGTGDDEPQDVGSLPSWAQKLLKKTREEAARARTSTKQKLAEQAEADRLKAIEETKASVTDAVVKALGLKNDEEQELTPEQVIEKISAERDAEKQAREERDLKYRDLLVEVAVQDAATQLGADPSRLVDSRNFMRTLKELNVDDPSYRVAVAKAVQAAVEENPLFRIEQKPRPPAVSGGTAPAGVKGKAPEDMTIDELREARIHRRS
jgi:hypothetical protein